MGTLMEIAVDSTLVAITSAWAQWLTRHKDFEPDHTYAQVIAGVALCLAVARARARATSGAREASERDIWRALALGGTPIVVGELAQWLDRRADRRRYLAQRQ